MRSKTCNKCGKEKNIHNFNKKTKNGKHYLKSQCKSCESEYIKKYYEKNKETIKQYQKKWRQENEQGLKERSKQYYENNKEKVNKKNIQRQKIRYQEDINYRLTCSLRSRLRDVLKGKNKSQKTMDILGCSKEELREHLEAQFTKGMSWDNYGKYGWHIDHIIPLSSAKTEEELIKLFHYTNTQPLWSDENLKKSNKIF